MAESYVWEGQSVVGRRVDSGNEVSEVFTEVQVYLIFFNIPGKLRGVVLVGVSISSPSL